MDTYTRVKNRLLDLCAERGITVNKLAQLSGVQPSTVKNILYGKSKNPGVVTLGLLCDGLGIGLSDFFGSGEFSKNNNEE